MPKDSRTKERRDLRSQAEARLASHPAATSEGLPSMRLLHELQVHHVELEMQIEELRRTQRALEDSRDQYRRLYDFAPVGYLTLSIAGLIQEANLTAAGVLNVDRKALVGRPFAAFVEGDSDKWHLFFSTLVRRGEPRTCDLSLHRSDGSVLGAHLSCDYRATADTDRSVRVVLTDVTEFMLARQRFDALRPVIRAPTIAVASGVSPLPEK